MREEFKRIKKQNENVEHKNKNLEREYDEVKRKVKMLENSKMKREGY